MVIKNAKNDLLGKDKIFAKRDTSYSSFWLYNKYNDMNSEHLKDSFVNFFDDTEILSEFSPAVAKNIISFWSEENDKILDPFAGRTRALVSVAMNREYIGFDISKPVSDYINSKLSVVENKTKYAVNATVFNNDCKNISILGNYWLNKFNLLFTCPPYWHLEKYGNEDGQLSAITNYDLFLKELVVRLVGCLPYLAADAYIAIVIGDFRHNGEYITLHSDLIQKLKDILIVHDIIAIQNIPFHTAAFYFGQAKKYKKTAKAHEYLLVFKKKKYINS